MDIILRRLGSADVGLALTLNETIRPGLGDGEGMRSFLADERAWLYVALCGNSIIAFAYGWECPRLDGGRMLYIHEVAVAEGCRRKGVGKRMIGALLEECARRGIAKMFLFTQHGNAAANALYRSMGGGVSPDSQGEDTVYWFRVSTKKTDDRAGH